MRKPGFDVSKKTAYENAILKNQRELEDMEREIKVLLQKHQEDNLLTLWKEINIAIERVAQANGYQIVLGYGDPIERDMFSMSSYRDRKLSAMDQVARYPSTFTEVSICLKRSPKP